MKATSMDDSSTVYTQNVSYNEYYASGQYAFASMNFSAGYYSNGGENFIITISVSGGSTTTLGSEINIDNVMLENSVGNSAYGMTAFGSFEPFSIDSLGNQLTTPNSQWTLHPTGTFTTTKISAPFNNVAYFAGALNVEKSISQTIYRATASDYEAWELDEEYDTTEKIYKISGFAKGTNQTNNASSAFRLRVEVQYYRSVTDGRYIKTFTFDFENSQTDWQFISGSFVTNPTYTSDDTNQYGMVEEIRVYCDYFNNPGTVYFDNINVSRAEKETTLYSYYKNGNIASSKTGWYSEWNFYSDDNTGRDLVRKFTSDKTYIEYTYDNHLIETQLVSKYTGHYNPITDTIYNGTLIPQTITTYAYNTYGLMTSSSTTSLNDPEGTEIPITTSNTYNISPSSRIFGSLETTTNENGQTTRYFYNSSTGYLIAVINPDNTTGTYYDYDAIGRTTMIRPATLNSSTPSAVSSSAQVTYDYNPLGWLCEIQTDSTTYNFRYDSYGNTDIISAGNYDLVDYTYRANNGKISTVEYGNGFIEKYEYNELDMISKIQYTNSSGSYVDKYLYSYDANGNIYKLEDKVSGKTYLYKYDDQNRMTQYIIYDSATMINESSAW